MTMILKGEIGVRDEEEFQVQQSASPRPEARLALWLALADRMQRKARYRSFESRPQDDLQSFALS